MNEIVININEANKAQKYQKKEELFQIEAFKRVAEILKEHKVAKDTNDITDCRFHDTIFIDGDRGVGKTAFMINIENYYKNIAEIEKPNYIFLKPVDPTLLEHTEKFLSVVLARIIEYVNDNKNNFDNLNMDKYYKSLENLSKSLSSIKTLPDDIGIDEIASNKSSLKLEQHSHDFFKEVCLIFDTDGIVMLIDDVDMAFDKGFDVLEVVRKYLASPFLIPIVAGDMKLYKEIVETQFMYKTNFLQDVNYLKNIYGSDELKFTLEYISKKELIDNLVEQYLHKIFPSEYHIQLENIYKILKDNYVILEFDDKFKVTYKEVKDFEIRHLNIGINQVEFTFEIFANNTRDFIQYLYNKRNIYEIFFRKIDKYVYKKDKNIIYSPLDSALKYDDNIMNYIYTNNDDNLNKTFKKTADFYKFSNDRKKRELSQLSFNDYESFEDNRYNIYKAFSSDIFSKLQKFRNIEESVKNYSIKGKSIDDALKINNYYFNLSSYITELFVFNDYFSSYQRRNYIFTGNFLEMIIYSFSLDSKLNEIKDDDISLINKMINPMKYKNSNNVLINILDDETSFRQLCIDIYNTLYSMTEYEELEKILNSENIELNKKCRELNIDKEYILKINKNFKNISTKIPFGSEFMNNKRYKEESDNLDEVEFSGENNYDLSNEISRSILIWKRVFCQNVKLNSLSMYEIVYKFFTNIEKLKWIEVQELKTNQPIIFLRRIVLILINSIAFFEREDEDVANINIAISKEFSFKNTLSKNQASLKNIKPMLEKEGSLTRALFFHPVISHILFFNGEQNFHKLKFIESFNIEDFIESIPRYKDGKAFTIEKRIEILKFALDKLIDKENLKMLYNNPKFKSDVISKVINNKDKVKISEFNKLKEEIENKIK